MILLALWTEIICVLFAYLVDISAKCYHFLTVLLKVYTINGNGFGSYIHSSLFLQGSAAAELGCAGKF